MKRSRKQFINNLVTYAIVIVAFVICQVMQANGSMSRSLRGQMIPICAYIVMAISLNLTVGISGELSLGHAGFMSVGAFSGGAAAAVLASAVPNPTLRLLLAMVVGGLCAAAAGVIIGVPVLRLRGDYLAIVTLAFGEIIRNVLNCVYLGLEGGALRFSFNAPITQSAESLAAGEPFEMLINGPLGLQVDDRIASFAVGFALVLFTLFVVLNLIQSRTGRAIMAIRDNRIAAESVGLSVTKYKMIAFVISAGLAGMAGTLFGLDFSSLKTEKFKFDTSILVLVFVVLGGIGNIRGSIIAAALLTVLPEMLRSFKTYRMLIYAVVLIAVMLLTNNEQLKRWRAGLAEKFGRGKRAEGGL